MSDRVEYLRAQHSADLLKAFRADPRNRAFDVWLTGLDDEGAADALFQRYAAADPSRRKENLQWLLARAINGGAKRGFQGGEEQPYRSALPAEDLGKAAETLQAFMDYKRRLDPAQRDLGRYPSLGAVWNAVAGYVQENAPVSNNDLDRREREAALAESDILFEAEGLIVAVPKTQAAAVWWGRGTRWCTAARDNNMFDDYAKDGALAVLVVDGEKYQVHGASRSFMDASDTPVEGATLASKLKAIFGDRLPVIGAALADPANTDLRGLMLSLNATSSKLPAIPGAPALAPMTPEHEAAAHAALRFGKRLDKLGYAWIPETLAAYVGHTGRIREFARPWVAALGEGAEERVIGAYRDWMSRRLDVNPLAIQDAGEYDENDDPIRRNGWPLDDLLDRDLCLRAVRLDGMALDHVPWDLRDAEMAEIAVAQAPENMDFVPMRLRGPLSDELVRSRPDLLMFAGWEWRLQNLERCFEAVARDPRAIRGFPDVAVTEDLALDAVRRDPTMAGSVVARFRTVLGHRRDEVLVSALNAAADRNVFYKTASGIALADIGSKAVLDAAVAAAPDSDSAALIVRNAAEALTSEHWRALLPRFDYHHTSVLQKMPAEIAYEHFRQRYEPRLLEGEAGACLALHNLPNPSAFRDAILAGIARNHLVYSRLPPALRDEALTLDALRQAESPYALNMLMKAIPDDVWTPTVYAAAWVRSRAMDAAPTSFFHSIPEGKRAALVTADLCEAYTSWHPEGFSHLPVNQRTRTMALEALIGLGKRSWEARVYRHLAPDVRRDVERLADRMGRSGVVLDDLFAEARRLDAAPALVVQTMPVDPNRIRAAASFLVNDVMLGGAEVAPPAIGRASAPRI